MKHSENLQEHVNCTQIHHLLMPYISPTYRSICSWKYVHIIVANMLETAQKSSAKYGKLKRWNENFCHGCCDRRTLPERIWIRKTSVSNHVGTDPRYSPQWWWQYSIMNPSDTTKGKLKFLNQISLNFFRVHSYT